MDMTELTHNHKKICWCITHPPFILTCSHSPIKIMARWSLIDSQLLCSLADANRVDINYWATLWIDGDKAVLINLYYLITRCCCAIGMCACTLVVSAWVDHCHFGMVWPKSGQWGAPGIAIGESSNTPFQSAWREGSREGCRRVLESFGCGDSMGGLFGGVLHWSVL